MLVSFQHKWYNFKFTVLQGYCGAQLHKLVYNVFLTELDHFRFLEQSSALLERQVGSLAASHNEKRLVAVEQEKVNT